MIADLVRALRMAAQTFRHYEFLHQQKHTEESVVKAQTNAAKAEMCESALAKYEASEGGAVAWMVLSVGSRHLFFDRADAEEFARDQSSTIQPLYASPPAALQEGALSDDVVHAALAAAYGGRLAEEMKTAFGAVLHAGIREMLTAAFERRAREIQEGK